MGRCLTAAFLSAATIMLIAGGGRRACAQEPASGLEEVLSVGDPDGDKLLMWVGLAVDDDGSLFVTDALDYGIKLFDSRGNLLKRTGRAGEGPGEFKAIRELALSRSLVYVTDQYQPRISVFDKALKFLYGIPLTGPVHCLRALSDGTVMAAFPPVGKGEYETIWSGDSRGRTLARIPHGTDPDLADEERAAFAPAGSDIILAYNFKDRLVRMDRQGRVRWVRNLNHFPDAGMERRLGFKLPSHFLYKDVVVDGLGRIYVLGGTPARHPSRDVYVLDPEGKLLTTLVLPEASHCLVLDGKGFLYSRAGEGTTIKKFRVILPRCPEAKPGEKRSS
jgi:hypothetical protein